MDALPIVLLVNTADDRMLDLLLNKLLAGRPRRVFPRPQIIPFPGPHFHPKQEKDTVLRSGPGRDPRPAA